MAANGIIIGGGIAGLCAALALRQKGLRADVYESAPQIMPVGSGIWMAPNAMQVFERLGIAQQINAAGMPLRRIAITDGNYKTIMQSDQALMKARFGHTTTAILRARLQDILLRALPPDAVHLSKTVTGIAEDADALTVAFSDGSRIAAPYVIAADGIHSVVRSRLFPDSRLSPVKNIVWRGLSPVVLLPQFRKAIIEAWHGGLRFGFSEVEDGLVDWFAVEPAQEAAAGTQHLKERLIHAFSAFSYPVKEILLQSSESKIIRNEIRDVAPLRSWSKGRVCLIGDAAHASTPYMGQGGCQAVEDAYVLAQCLSSGKTPPAAFAALQTIRLKAAQHVVYTSRMIGQAGSLKNFAATLRNMAIRATPQPVIERQFFRVYTLTY